MALRGEAPTRLFLRKGGDRGGCGHLHEKD